MRMRPTLPKFWTGNYTNENVLSQTHRITWSWIITKSAEAASHRSSSKAEKKSQDESHNEERQNISKKQGHNTNGSSLFWNSNFLCPTLPTPARALQTVGLGNPNNLTWTWERLTRSHAVVCVLQGQQPSPCKTYDMPLFGTIFVSRTTWKEDDVLPPFLQVPYDNNQPETSTRKMSFMFSKSASTKTLLALRWYGFAN